jgi:hypothetical protein
MISRKEYLRGRDLLFPEEFTQQMSDNTDEFLETFNKVRAAWGKPMTVNSGYRPQAVNASTPNAAKGSCHTICRAIDINDPDGSLWKWTLENLELMTKLGLYMEDVRWTRTKSGGGWCHYQNLPPKSKKRIFIPSESLAIAPNFWNGVYPSKYDK